MTHLGNSWGGGYKPPFTDEDRKRMWRWVILAVVVLVALFYARNIIALIGGIHWWSFR